MKRVLTILCALALLVASTAPAQIEYGWTISASNTDPEVNTSAALPTGAPVAWHLWFWCGQGDGISAADFSLNFDGSTYPGMFSYALTMHNGWLRVTDADLRNMLLAVGGCPPGPVLVATWGGFNTGLAIAHNFCLVNSPEGNLAGVDCAPVPQSHPVKQRGLAAGVPQTCDTGPCTSPVEATTWGAVKALYR